MNKNNIKCSDCTEENPCPKMTITTSLPEPENTMPPFSYKLLDIKIPKIIEDIGIMKLPKIGPRGPGSVHFPLRNIKKMLEIEDKPKD